MLVARSRRFAAIPLLFALVLALPACDSTTEPPPSQDTVIGGVNFTRLFAPATDAEVQAVRADWAARTPTASGIQVTGPAPAPDGSLLYVVSHEITSGPGASGRHYGFVRIPAGAVNAPVLVVHHGGDDGVFAGLPDANAGVLAMAQAFPTLFSQTVQVFPTYRAELLGTQGFEAALGQPVLSGGTPSPWDYDVDDAMALLSAVLARDEFSAATDDARVGALGFSRGANTALLQSARDPRIRAVTQYYAPSDFFSAGIQALAGGVLLGDPRALSFPGAGYLNETVLQPLRGPNGTYNAGADYAQARLGVARRSATLFTASLRNVQVHHHQADPVVPYAVSVSFDAAARARPVQGAYEFNTYTDALPAGVSYNQHNPLAMPASLARTQAFLAQYVVNAPAARLVAAN